MKKILLILILVVSCNSDKKVKPIVCIDLIQYYEPPRHNMTQSSILIDIEVKDSSLSKKLESGQLKGIVFSSKKKEDRVFLYTDLFKPPIKKENKFSFVIRTNYFRPNISDIKNHKKREWESDEVLKALNGDIGLVFDKDTILAKSCLDKKMIIQMINE